MWIFWYILALLLTVLTWYLLLRLCSKHSQHYFYILEYGIYSFLIGVVVIPFVLFIFAWMGGQLSLMWMLFLVLWLNILLLILNIARKTTLHFASSDVKQQFLVFPARLKIWSLLFVIWLLAKLIFGFMDITNVPTYQDDTFGNWNYRAKVFYERESLVLDKQDKDYLWQGYKQYPLTPSLYKTYLMKFTGYRHEWLVNLPSFLFYISALSLVFFWLLRITKKLTWAWLWALLLSWIPLYYIHWTNPYFDVFQSVYFFAALAMLYGFLKNKLSVIFPILFVWILWYTKSEWLIIFMISALVTYLLRYFIRNKWSLSKESLRSFWLIIWWALLINLPFIIFKLTHGLWFGNGEANVTQTALSLHTEIFYPLYIALFKWWCYNLLFSSFVVALFYVLYKKRLNMSSSLLFLLWFLISFAAIIFIYLTTFTFQYVVDQTGINRSMMQIIPVLVFVLVLLVRDGYETEVQ